MSIFKFDQETATELAKICVDLRADYESVLDFHGGLSPAPRWPLRDTTEATATACVVECNAYLAAYTYHEMCKARSEQA